MFRRIQSLWAETRTRTTESIVSPALCHCPLDLIHLIFLPALMENGRFYPPLPTRGNPLPWQHDRSQNSKNSSSYCWSILHFHFSEMCRLHCLPQTVFSKWEQSNVKTNAKESVEYSHFCFVSFFEDFRSAPPVLHCWSVYHWSKERLWILLH